MITKDNVVEDDTVSQEKGEKFSLRSSVEYAQF